MSAQKVLVIGSGGIGSLYGALLHKVGWRVDMVARSDYEIIAQQGVHIDSILGDLSFRPTNVYHSVEKAEKADWILLCIKMLAALDLPKLLAPVVTPQTKICLIANGLDIEVPIAEAFPTNPLISCVAFVGSSRTSAGHVKHSAYGGLIMGSYLQNEDNYCQQLAAAFKQAGIQASISEDITRERWKKSIWNASFNPLSVVTNGADTGKLLATAEAESLVRSLMAEVIATARAEGYELADILIDKNIETTRAMPSYLTSMALDYLHDDPIELEALLGSVVHYANKHSVPVPHLNTLYQTLKIRYL